MEGGTGRPELSWPRLILFQSCGNEHTLDWQSFGVSQWPGNQSMRQGTSGLSLVFLHLLDDLAWWEISLPFVSVLEDPLYDAEDKRSRAGMGFATAGAEARGHSGHCDSSGLCHLAQEEQIHCNEL